jgi:hypothetical protein
MVDHDLAEHPVDRVIVWPTVVDLIESLMKCDKRLTRVITEIHQIVSDTTERVESGRRFAECSRKEMRGDVKGLGAMGQ